MKNYQTTAQGSFTIDGMTIPNSGENRHYRQLQDEVAAGDATILPYTPPADTRTVRDKRQERYIDELSPEGDFQKTTGDMLDALVKAIYGDTSELDLLAAQINQIKQDLPEE
jgi:hypothetical protein